MKNIFTDKKTNIVAISFSIIQYICTFLTSGILLSLAVGSALSDLGQIDFDSFINKYAIYLFIIPALYFLVSMVVYLIAVRVFISSKENLKKYVFIVFIIQIIITLIVSIFNSTEIRDYITQLFIAIIENLIILSLVYLIGRKVIKNKPETLK